MKHTLFIGQNGHGTLGDVKFILIEEKLLIYIPRYCHPIMVCKVCYACQCRCPPESRPTDEQGILLYIYVTQTLGVLNKRVVLQEIILNSMM